MRALAVLLLLLPLVGEARDRSSFDNTRRANEERRAAHRTTAEIQRLDRRDEQRGRDAEAKRRQDLRDQERCDDRRREGKTCYR